MRRAANLETTRRGKELALRVNVMTRKEVAQADQRGLRKGKHDRWSSTGGFPRACTLRYCFQLPGWLKQYSRRVAALFS